jgi:hypothetical protein
LTATEPLLPSLVACLLALAVVVAVGRLLWQQRRAAPAQRARPWRIAVLVLAQPLCAGLLLFALLPPARPGEAAALVAVTSGATAAQLAGVAGEGCVALPEAPEGLDCERAPDLATALRRHPEVRRVRVVGAGLEARDQEAVRGMAVEFHPAPLPRGLVELAAPARVAAGGGFHVGGRASGLPGGSAELLDPGGRRVARAALGGDGRFTLGGAARLAGPAVFTLRLHDARQAHVEDVHVPLQVEAEPAPRVLMLAGAPNPEWKYLRRWASDAGVSLHTQVAVGRGVQLGDPPIRWDAATLGRFDLLVLDERAWSSLDEARYGVLVQALRGGLGVLLQVTAALPERERDRLRALGLTVDAGRDVAEVRLARPQGDDELRARLGPGTRDAPRPRDGAVAEVPALSRRALRVDSADASPLLRDAAGHPLAAWRAEGRGRIGLWTLTDSYRLVLAGRDDLHGESWSAAFTTLARARPQQPVTVQGEGRLGDRVDLCGVAPGARVVAPDGATARLLPGPASHGRACAGYWPRMAGWHRLHAGEAQEQEGQEAAQEEAQEAAQLFMVRARDAAPGLHAAAVAAATWRKVAEAPAAAPTTDAPVRQPGSRWPWWLAWLLASAGLWWLERARFGRAVAPQAPG